VRVSLSGFKTCGGLALLDPGPDDTGPIVVVADTGNCRLVFIRLHDGRLLRDVVSPGERPVAMTVLRTGEMVVGYDIIDGATNIAILTATGQRLCVLDLTTLDQKHPIDDRVIFGMAECKTTGRILVTGFGVVVLQRSTKMSAQTLEGCEPEQNWILESAELVDPEESEESDWGESKLTTTGIVSTRKGHTWVIEAVVENIFGPGNMECNDCQLCLFR
jgi:hypothetical protein